MGATTIPAPSSAAGVSDNWVLISTTTASASTLSITGISGYKKLKVIYNTLSAPQISALRFNNDSGTKYSSAGWYVNNSNQMVKTVSAQLTSTAIESAPSSTENFNLEINSTDTTNAKTYTVLSGGTLYFATTTGTYQATASISSIQFTWVGTSSAVIYLYGVAV